MHIPVLKNELLNLLNIRGDGIYVDCTAGCGGHAEAVLNLLKDGRLILIDRDPQACEKLRQKFRDDSRATVVWTNFQEVNEVLKELGTEKVDGLYADFGVSNWQLATPERGFSFKHEGILDMRMDNTKGESAREVVNKYSKELLSEIIYRFGEEKFHRRIADNIVKRRELKPFETTKELAEVVKNSIPLRYRKKSIHPATLTFQALRIHVNSELVSIENLLRVIPDLVKSDGIAAFISFHSLEDRLVKSYFAQYKNPCTCPPDIPVCVCGKVPSFKILTKKPITPTTSEINRNSLARSAKLRAAQRI
jgi:16S rRNA (cytosine1402-N4)-methyltransferase